MSGALPNQKGVFTRASSGLVRQVKTSDVFYFSWQTIALSYIVFVIFAWVFYPGASMIVATLIATVFGLLIAACYALMAAVYPRSGAEYVFLSRSLNPAVGFAFSFNFAFWQIFYVGLNAAFLCQFALQPAIAALGIQTGNDGLLALGDWFGTGTGLFVTGTVLILAVLGLHLLGAGKYFKWQRIGTWIAMASLAVTVVVLILAATGALNFQENFNAIAGTGAYDQVIADAKDAGLAVGAQFSWGQTLAFVLWPAFSLWFAITAVSFSGEVKNVQRSQLVGMLSGVLAMGITFAILMALYQGAFGSDFLQAATNGTPLAAAPFTPLLTAIAGGSPILTIVMSIWVVVIAFFVLGSVFVYPSRTLLAWSIDGLAPRKLGAVNARYHSPHVALITCAVLGIVVLALYSFSTVLGIVSGFLGLGINFLVVAVWSILFPFVRRSTFDASPIAWRVGGIPVLSIIGLFATIGIVPVMYLLVTDTTFSLNLTYVIWGAILSVVAGFLWYFVWWISRRGKAANEVNQFAEIPIE
jgi:amino acid transporter